MVWWIGITMHSAWWAQAHGGWKRWSSTLCWSLLILGQQFTWHLRERRLRSLAALSARLLTCSSDSPYVLWWYSEPIGCWINLMLNSWRFAWYVFEFGRLRFTACDCWSNIQVIVSTCSILCFDYITSEPLNQLCAHLWLVDPVVVTLPSILKSGLTLIRPHHWILIFSINWTHIHTEYACF